MSDSKSQFTRGSYNGSGDREAILGRIAEALRVPARLHGAQPLPHAHGGAAATAPFRQWLPQSGAGVDEQIALFARLSETLRTEFCLCPSAEAAAGKIDALAREDGWKRIALHSGALTDAVAAKLWERVELLRVDQGYEKDAMESSDAGLTECESLVAQTGSVCVSSPSSGGRVLSVFPAHHIVIARREQMLPDLPSAFEHLASKYASGYPSFISFITGPSRTGDIERILGLGAHGPKKLTVLLLP